MQLFHGFQGMDSRPSTSALFYKWACNASLDVKIMQLFLGIQGMDSPA